MPKESMITTIDNPWDYFTQFDDWEKFDSDHGYFTWNYIARVANVSIDMPEEMAEQIIDNTMEEIVRINSGLYKFVYKD